MLATFNNNLPADEPTARRELRHETSSSDARLESIQAFFGQDQPYYCEPAPTEPTSSPAPATPFHLPIKKVSQCDMCRALRGTAVRVCRPAPARPVGQCHPCG